ncbi:hypothetical protein [Knoellia sp. LjRoot47]|uniref:hypothetical protein n=1 Tax=Knoellia sp. LjRoot47 TaxID=3342330 RepID=UPI003ECE757C
MTTDAQVADDVIGGLAAARGNLQHVWRGVEELQVAARGAERALDDVECETAAARMADDGWRGTAYLETAGAQMDVVRKRCADSSSLAAELIERLEAAKSHLTWARQRLEAFSLAQHSPTVAELRTQVEELTSVVDLATPLAQAVQSHMHGAAATAVAATTAREAYENHQQATLRVDRGLHEAGREVARADEAVRHLDRAVELAVTGAGRSLGRAEGVANSAHDRLRAAQRRTAETLPPVGRSAPSR